MQANTMLYKVVPQRAGGFNILCGFNPKLVFSTAERVTSEAETLTTEGARIIAERHAADLNAESIEDVTAGSVIKKLLKNEEMSIVVNEQDVTFAGMRIGSYL